MIFNTYNWIIFVSSKIWCRIFLIVRVVLTSSNFYCFVYWQVTGGGDTSVRLWYLSSRSERSNYVTQSLQLQQTSSEKVQLYKVKKQLTIYTICRRKIGKYKFDQLKEKFCFRKKTTHVQWVCWVTMKSSSSPIKGKLKYSECTIIECIACRSLP